jgi:membrane protease YdiL (CAAX protease family)
MASNNVRAIGVAVLLGLATFMLLMGACMGLVFLNARISPEHAWFPIPALVICLGFAVFAQRRWQIGLTHPAGVPWGRIYLLALTTTVTGVCVAILQGAWFGMTRAAELGPEGTSDQFQFAFAFVLPLVAAILAEVAFRGVMQGRLHALMAPLPAILLVTSINTAAHRWGPDLAAQWLGYFALLAGCGYVRWLSGSIIPSLTAHFWQNFALAFATYYWGPFAQGEFSAVTLAAVGASATLALIVSVVIGRGTAVYRGRHYGRQTETRF